MIEQCARTYDVPRALAGQWVTREQVLPLLDGLGEMADAARPACIAAINAYQWIFFMRAKHLFHYCSFRAHPHMPEVPL